jgi:signal transduction histidine kinase/CheY-like chemotaxis protein
MVYFNFSFVDVHFWNSLLVVFLLTSAVAFFHFVRALLGKPEPRLWLSLGYGSCILVAIAAFMGYTVDFAYWSGGTYHMQLGIATYAMTPISIAFVNASIFNLFQARRATKDPFTRNRVTYPLVGMSIYAVLSLTNFLPGWKWYPVDQGGNLINAGLVACAVLIYRLIDIQIAFRRGLLYSLQTLILGGIFLGIGVALFAGFGGYDLIRWVPGVMIALLVAITIPQVYRLTRRWLNWLFSGEEHDYRRTLRAISSAMSAMPDLEDQADWLMKNVMKTVQAAKGGLFLLDEEQKRYVLKALKGYDDPELDGTLLEGDNPVIGRLAKSDRCLVAEDLERVSQLRGLWQSEREQLRKLETEVLVPVKAKGNLIGVILLGPKRSRRMYSVDNLELLYTVANQAAVAIENTRLYQETKDRAEWIEMIGRLTKVIGSTLDIDRVYETFNTALKNLVDFDRISIEMIEGDKLRVLALSSDVPAEQGKGTIIALKKSSAAWAIAHKSTNIEQDLAQERLFPVDEILLQYGFRSAIRVPLLSQGEVFGTLNLASRRPAAYGEREQKILEQIAGQLAVAIQNALLFDQAKQAYEEAKRAYEELNTAHEYMVRSEKLRALGEMAGGIAHDFNNVLSVILGRAQLALEDVENPRLEKSLKAIEQAALDAAKTVRRLQDFTRVRTDQDFYQVDVSHLIKSVLQMAEPRLAERWERDKVEISASVDLGRVGTVRGDSAELREALINIIFNAVDAMPEGGKITIKGWQEDHRVILSVADTGAGIPDEVKSKIFDPFFSTKGRDGVGLGLSITYGIITRHGGSIDVESKLGEGSTFYVRLPLGDGTKGKEPSPPPPEPTEKTTIMLVDDDPEVSEVLELMLTQMGHEVAIFTKGEEAIALFDRNDYRLVITDLGMPDISGWDVAKAVKQKKPETPVVLITGWGIQLDDKEMAEAGIDGVIAKPFGKQALGVQLAKLLNGAG